MKLGGSNLRNVFFLNKSHFVELLANFYLLNVLHLYLIVYKGKDEFLLLLQNAALPFQSREQIIFSFTVELVSNIIKLFKNFNSRVVPSDFLLTSKANNICRTDYPIDLKVFDPELLIITFPIKKLFIHFYLEVHLRFRMVFVERNYLICEVFALNSFVQELFIITCPSTDIQLFDVDRVIIRI